MNSRDERPGKAIAAVILAAVAVFALGVIILWLWTGTWIFPH